MRRFLSLAFCVALLGSAASAQTSYAWTGIGNGWKNQVAPPNNGTAVLLLGESISNKFLFSSGLNSIHSAMFTGGDNFTLDAAAPMTLSLAGGIFASGFEQGRLSISGNVDVNLSGSPAFDFLDNTLVISGHLVGTVATLSLTQNTDPGGNYLPSFYIFNNTGSGNTYAGDTMIGSAFGTPTVAFWNSSPFGTGKVSLYNGGVLIAHGIQTVANDITFNRGGSTEQPVVLESWDGPLTFTGTITLANNVTILTTRKSRHFPNEDNTEAVYSPGPRTRQPIIFTGNLGDNGLARTLTTLGTGLVILRPASGSNTYSGGTTLNGSLIFGNNQAIPTTGTVMVNFPGYAGLGDVGPANFATQFGDARFDKYSAGAIGVDTLPGNSIVTLSDRINLSSTGGNGTIPLGFTNSSLRLGSATSAILTGGITPQGTDYRFGNGGGSLYVQSSLGDVADNGVSVIGRRLDLFNQSTHPLKLYLQGTNTYTGGTKSYRGILVFDGSSALPASGSLQAVGDSSNVGNGYIGYTDTAGIGAAVIGANAATFLAKFDAANTWGIIGFDTHEGNSTSNITGAINLSGFNDGVFLGTATSAILSGAITPSTVANTANTANTLRLTVTNGGTLSVSSTLADSGSPLSLRLGTDPLSDGTILLNGVNSYTGGTTVGGLILVAGNNTALGAGAVFVDGFGFSLQAGTAGLNLANPIYFSANSLYLTGTNAFTLSGNITGSETNSIALVGPDSPTVTLSGNNSGYSGTISLYTNSTLNLAHNNAAGQGALSFESAGATVAFIGAATAPFLHGLSGAAGSLVLPNGTNLTIDTGNMARNYDFGGVISGPGGAVTTASLTVTTANLDTEFFYLYGHNQYTGGTSITGHAALALGASDSAGSGLITINATDGGLALNAGVALTNPIQFTAGGLAGLGTFAPTSVNGVAGGAITVGAGQMVFPGIPGDGSIPGKLTLATDVVFANGGQFILSVEDPVSAEGYGSLNITGRLDLTSISLAGFALRLTSIGQYEYSSYSPAIVWGNSYNLLIVTASGGITGFNPTNFAIDVTKFQSGLIPVGSFSLTNPDATHLYLNFTAVPEPSTWTLLATGAGFLGLVAWRRRRA